MRLCEDEIWDVEIGGSYGSNGVILELNKFWDLHEFGLGEEETWWRRRSMNFCERFWH